MTTFPNDRTHQQVGADDGGEQRREGRQLMEGHGESGGMEEGLVAADDDARGGAGVGGRLDEAVVQADEGEVREDVGDGAGVGVLADARIHSSCSNNPIHTKGGSKKTDGVACANVFHLVALYPRLPCVSFLPSVD